MQQLAKTASATTGTRTQSLPKHRQILITHLITGRVPPPIAWLDEADLHFLSLPVEVALAPGEAEHLGRLIGLFAELFELIDQVIAEFVAQRRGELRLMKHDLDSLKRTRGPRAVRDALFTALPDWPTELDQQFRAISFDALGATLLRRNSRQAAANRTDQEIRVLVSPHLEPARAAVLDWAKNTGLPRETVDLVISDVIDALVRYVKVRLTAPADLTRWVKVTAKWRWRDIRSRRGMRSAVLLPASSPVQDAIGDATALRVDLLRATAEAAARLRRQAQAHRTHPRPSPDNALMREIAAGLLETADFDRLADIVEANVSGVADLSAVMSNQGLGSERGRHLAMRRFVRDELRRALSDG